MSVNIPVVVVEPEQGDIPKYGMFYKRPAETVQEGDVLWLRNKPWRVVQRRAPSSVNIRYRFTCHPCQGGRPESFVFFSREWVEMWRQS